MNIIFKVSSILTLFFLIGCSSHNPLPFQQKVNTTGISSQVKQNILNLVIEDNRDKYNSENGCLYISGNAYTDYDYHMYGSYKNCFLVKNNLLIREDQSSCRYNRTKVDCNYILRKSFDYSEYLNKLQLKLPSLYRTKVKEYKVFLPKYNKLLKQLELQLKRSKIIVNDNTNTLPKKIVKQLSKKVLVETEYEADKIKAFKMYGNNISCKNFKEKYILDTNRVDRYVVKYDTNIIKKSCNVGLHKIYFRIKSVSYLFLPENFTIKDNFLTIQIINSNGHLSTIKFINNSKKFLEINSLSGYYGGKVKNNILLGYSDKKIKIAPMSSVTYDQIDNVFSSFPEESIIPLKNKNEKIQYGFAVEYTVGNKLNHKNIYKVGSYTVNSFK